MVLLAGQKESRKLLFQGLKKKKKKKKKKRRRKERKQCKVPFFSILSAIKFNQSTCFSFKRHHITLITLPNFLVHKKEKEREREREIEIKK